MSDLDSFLFRKISAGKEFEKVIPKSRNEKVDGGYGNTDHSIEKMVFVVNTYSWQMRGVANLLQKRSLKKTVEAIYDFTYNHFQYKADGAEQMLRSPARSWRERYIGIDCKSYSIIASSILTQMDILHYIRKVKQPGLAPNEFTHVYVVVPVDQETGNLHNGYYTIDGTVHDNKEVVFLGTKDYFMEGLQHSILNGPGLADPIGTSNGGTTTGTTNTGTTTQGTSGSTWNAAGNAVVDYGKTYVKENSKNWIKKINFKSVGKWFNFRCIGGEALDNAAADREIASLGVFANTLVNEMNDALNANNIALFNQKYNDYRGLTGALVLAGVKKYNEGWNGCTRENMVEVLKALSFYFQGGFLKSLDTWRDQYFNVVDGPTKLYSAQSARDRGAMPFMSYTVPVQAWTPKTFVLTKKPEFQNVPNFLPTTYTYQVLDTPAAFNPQTYLNTLQQAYNAITNPGSIITGGGNQPGNTPGTTQNPNDTTDTINDGKKPTQAGLGVLGFVLVGGGLLWAGMEAFKQDKPAKKPN